MIDDLKRELPESIVILKTCIGGAFYNRYLKATYRNLDILRRVAGSNVISEDQGRRAIILNAVSDHITEDHLHEYFQNRFGPVEKVCNFDGKPAIIFKREIHERGFLKSCFKLGMRLRGQRNRRNDPPVPFQSGIYSEKPRSNRFAHFTFDEIKDRLEAEELKRPTFLYELNLETIKRDFSVYFDQESVNAMTFELDPKQVPSVTYACQDFYDKNGKFVSHAGTRLPQIPMVDALFCLLFAPCVRIVPDQKRMCFEKLICDDHLEVPLSHVLTHKDIELVALIRHNLNKQLCDEEHVKGQGGMRTQFFIRQLFSMQRISVDAYKKLKDMSRESTKAETEPFKKEEEEEVEMNFFLEEESSEEGPAEKVGEPRTTAEEDGK